MEWHMAKIQIISMLIWCLGRESPGFWFGNHNNQWIVRLWCGLDGGDAAKGTDVNQWVAPALVLEIGLAKWMSFFKDTHCGGQLYSLGMDVKVHRFPYQSQSFSLSQDWWTCASVFGSEEYRLWSQSAWIPIPDLKCTSWSTSGKWQDLSVPLFLHIHSDHNTLRLHIILLKVVTRLNAFIYVKQGVSTPSVLQWCFCTGTHVS